MLPYNDVWVVCSENYYREGVDVVGVYSSLHLADMCVDKYRELYGGVVYAAPYKLNSMEV